VGGIAAMLPAYYPPVDFELAPEQRELQEAARQLLDGLASPANVRAHIAGGQALDRRLWTAMAEQGWLGVPVTESRGGLGLGGVEAALLLQEVGRHCAPVPLTPTVVALAALVEHDEHRLLLESLLRGEAIPCVAWARAADAVSESPGPDDAAGGAEAGVTKLHGRLGLVEAASVADVAVVLTPEAAWLVDLAATGRPAAEPAMDVTRSLSWLQLADTPARRLGGREEAARLRAIGAVASSADLLGGAERVLELATQYAKDRVQFGAPIGSFQAVKHRCADMLVDVEGMRSVTWYAAWAVTTGEPGWELAASTAKVWCADASKRVMASGLQVHGGIGFTWEHDMHLFIKRAQFSQLDYGDADYHRTLIAKGLQAAVAAGEPVM
jgi:alkylation response protein AidB-like acyl-CoA dehydrogenase